MYEIQAPGRILGTNCDASSRPIRSTKFTDKRVFAAMLSLLEAHKPEWAAFQGYSIRRPLIFEGFFEVYREAPV